MAENLLQLKAAQKAFVEDLGVKKRSVSTILAYGKDIEQLAEFLEGQKITQVSSVTKKLLDDFKDDLIQKKYTLKSVSRKLNAVKTFFRFLVSKGVISEDPAEEVIHPKYEPKTPRILSRLEYRALRDACRDDERIGAIVELMLQTGIRIGEVARLELSDIHENEIYIKAYESQPSRTVPLNKAGRIALERYLSKRPKTKTKAVFITKTGRPLLVRNIRTAIDRYFRIAGIEHAKVNDLRNTWIAHHLASGTSPVILSKLAGHKRLSTTEKYLEFAKKAMGEGAKLEAL